MRIIFVEQKRKLELVDGSNSDESKAALKRELYKMRAETELQKYNTEHRTKGVASYLYDRLLKNPLQKMAGERGLINTVDRKYYREELEEILNMRTLQSQYNGAFAWGKRR